MSSPCGEIEPHNCPTIDDLGGGCYLTIPPPRPVRRGYYRLGVHGTRGGTCVICSAVIILTTFGGFSAASG